ncbi:oligopeptide/dipeptide ABC transporter ATP-binding protein [Paenibacillus cellulosilyticus]|uniref:Oligopeptide/dipeptide ABC transporter ATP-binding protein n=1 Tax=Paenibacillus cellulosilyticus TaxID=375489 RepID=A0A2V2YXX8_9BACL|nr:ABC transporter ATP-binding protein [Paenibacillus cellulosilyticus]PWW07123.1 oligopeptide/dipeptide ABC transporter ATP-binding protein [Paenibacillus cellulosilyticus]QKS44665.1 ABC transporter ATP-binding protein [Paenibacillus cellulosilyticus]
MEPLLQIKELTAGFAADHGIVKAIDRISLAISKGQTLCLVGESGSGKSVTSLAIMRLLEFAGGRILEGSVRLSGDELTNQSQRQMIRIRGNRMAMIFQEPMSALNPVFTVGEQIAESIRLHQRKRKSEAKQMAVEMLRLVGIPDPETRAEQYPHELSGGMCQRVVIAIALACKPELLIADEPTTALDVTVQAQLLDLLQQLQRELGMTMLLITHDMGVAARMADQIAVMYAGAVVEIGTAEALFDHPAHPYTVGLMQSVPSMEGERLSELRTIRGHVPSLHALPAGCRFHPRCPLAMPRCSAEAPSMLAVGPQQQAACWLYDEDAHSSNRPDQESRAYAMQDNSRVLDSGNGEGGIR